MPATVSVTIPDPHVIRQFDALAGYYGWTLADGAKPAFVHNKLVVHFTEILRSYEVRPAVKAAGDTARSGFVSPGLL